MATGATRKSTARRRPRRGATLLRRLLSASLGLALLSLLGLAGWQLSRMPVNRVVVTGDIQQVSRDELMGVISDSISGGFLWVDLQVIREPLEALPWVHRAIVRRQWPDAIEVRVEEQRPIARWGDDAYLNHAGEVFRPEVGVDVSALPGLSGPAGSQAEVINHYQRVQEKLQPLGLRVAAMRMNARGGLTAELVEGGELVFDREELASQLGRLETIYRARLVERRAELARVDLRYSQGAAVAWRTDKKQET